ncbi:MAG: arabinogalactan endo-1,4-beta-galactosidase, partial [Bacteroidia bacterium]|nr:arabinogalactan endo-1,4-beta-galactosidase [Bacteroidia bacterium]
YYNANNQSQDVLTILKNNGLNVVRIRLWKKPNSIRSSFEEVKAFSQRARNNGLKVWLTVHYSDTWADPGHQIKPQQWENISFNTLKDSVYSYTKKIVTEIQPDYIQIGNEINPGFIFPEGNRYDYPEQFKALLNEGLQAVKDHSTITKSMIHYAGYSNAYGFFNSLSDLDYDIIAISYYPSWHGKDLNSLKNMILSLKSNMQKDLVIAEVAYPFTLGWNDWTNNIVGLEDQLIPDFPATPQGQKEFLEAINQICIDTESIGFCYWAPEWTAYRGDQATNGSNWENQTLFDFDGKILPAIDVFNN